MLQLVLALGGLTGAFARHHLILSSSSPTGASIPSCLADAYQGAYGGQAAKQDHLYFPSQECWARISDERGLYMMSGESVGTLWEVEDKARVRIFWVGQAGVEANIAAKSLDGEEMANEEEAEKMLRDIGEKLDALNTMMPTAPEETRAASSDRSQVTFDLPDTAEHISRTDIKIISPYADASSLIIIVPSTATSVLAQIDLALPPHLVPVALPFSIQSPASLHGATAENLGWIPVPQYRADYIANITKHLSFDSKLNAVLKDAIDIDQLRRDVRWLTGEAPSGWETRHSFTQGAIDAAHWIKEQAESTGQGLSCMLQNHLPSFSPNVICTYPSLSNSTEHVIFSAHYDSRGSFGQLTAPGGDDDGSGSGHLLGLARAIGREGITFDKKVQLCWFSGEEQGLLGSRAYAEKLYQANATVLLQVQADMLGYHVPGEPLQLGLPESIHLPEASQLLHNISTLYAPELVVGTTAACCSDHQSFLSLGFASTQVFERTGWIADPMYHNSGDVSGRDGYDLEQVAAIGKVTLGALMTVAGWSRNE